MSSKVAAAGLSLGAAVGLSRCCHNFFLFLFTNQAQRQKLYRYLRNGGNVLTMILPSATRNRTGTRRKLVDAAPVRIHHGACGSVGTQISRAENPITVGIDLAGE